MSKLPTMTGTALFDETGAYRWLLTRTWDPALPVAVLVMLNPSTADAMVLDPTVTRGVGFAIREGCGGLIVANAYGLRSTDPRGLWRVADPVGAENDHHIIRACEAATGPIIAAWGVHCTYLGRSTRVRELIKPYGPQCLGHTKGGEPKHPLYLRADTPLRPL